MAADSSTRHAYLDSPVDRLLVVARGDAVSGLYFEGHKYPPRDDALGPEVVAATDPVLARLAEELERYFVGELTEFTVPLDPHGDDFNRAVWRRLQLIPYGETTNYGTIAAELGNPHLAQRVGGAVGRNPISIVIPCHRVVAKDGSLTGFAGGLPRKAHLLAVEEPQSSRASRLF